jgi:hypothetical protein
VPIRADLRRLIILSFLCFAFAGFCGPYVLLAQVNRPLSSKWSPGAIPGGGGIAVQAYPIVSGHPFTANNDSRDVEMINGVKVTYESHSIVARDSSGRVATRTTESPQVPMPGENGRSASFIPAGGSINDPIAGVRLWWADTGPPQLDKVVMKNRMLRHTMRPGEAPLSACERESGQTRHLRSGATQQIENLGVRRIENLFAEGCRVTTFIPHGAAPSDRPFTATEDTWVSPKLRVTLLDVYHGSNGVERVKQLDNIVLGEPDSSLFKTPPGYTIRDMDAERKRQEQAEYTVEPGEPDAEMLAGAWEADDPFAPSPAQMGIFLHIVANRRVPFHHGRVTGNGPQKFQDMQFRVYERIGSKDEGGWFSTTGPNGGASWDGHRLRILPTHLGPGTFAPGEFALDLNFNEQKNVWTGSYTRGGVTSRVRLVRPGALLKAVPNPFLGVWSQSGRLGPSPPAPHIPRCVYIAQGSDGTLVSWSDTRFGPSIDSSEGFGTANFQENDGDTLTLQEGIYWASLGGNLPERFIGKLSPDGAHIIGSWMPHWAVSPVTQGRKQPPSGPVTTFTKITGESCWSQAPNQ